MKIKKIISTISDTASKFILLMAVHLPTFIILPCGFFFIMHILRNLDENTTIVTNTISGIALAFSAIFFTAAQLDNEHIDYRKDLVFSGERLLHSSMLVLFVTILKYSFLKAVSTFNDYQTTISIIEFILGSLIAIILLQSFLMAHSGFILINKILWKRYPNHKKWDNIF